MDLVLTELKMCGFFFRRNGPEPGSAREVAADVTPGRKNEGINE